MNIETYPEIQISSRKRQQQSAHYIFNSQACLLGEYDIGTCRWKKKTAGGQRLYSNLTVSPLLETYPEKYLLRLCLVEPQNEKQCPLKLPVGQSISAHYVSHKLNRTKYRLEVTMNIERIESGTKIQLFLSIIFLTILVAK